MKPAYYFLDDVYLSMYTCSNCYMPKPSVNEYYSSKIKFCAYCGSYIMYETKTKPTKEQLLAIENRLLKDV